MKISPHIHHQIRLKNLLITTLLLILLGLMGWLSTYYSAQIDLTANKSNSLSATSKKTLDALSDKVEIIAYIQKNQPIKAQIKQLIDRYSRYKEDLTLRFIDPDEQPEESRALNIGKSGAIIITYQERTEKLTFLDESSLTQALLQLASANESWVAFLSGHGERSSQGSANFDLSQFSHALAQRKINSQDANLAVIPALPDNTSVLVIANPKVKLLSGEMSLVITYLQKGGNLLWLTEPNNNTLKELADFLGIQPHKGTIVDKNTQLYGIDNPTFIVAGEYPAHPVTRDFLTITLYPTATALHATQETDFTATPLLNSSSQSWTETGDLKGDVRFDADGQEKEGSLPFAFALTRTLESHEQQRIIVIGDGDFLSNSYIDNVGNMDMGLRMINWLSHNDHFIDIPVKTTPDTNLQFSNIAIAIIGLGFLLVLPLLLLITGIVVWQRRKQQ